MDIERVNAAVKISVTLIRVKDKVRYKQLYTDLVRLQEGMTSEEYTEYLKRTN